jgi:hypothetical protein
MWTVHRRKARDYANSTGRTTVGPQGSNRANPKACSPHWHTVRRGCSRVWITIVSASVDSAFFISVTPVRRGHAAGAVCSCVEIASKSRPMLLANAGVFTRDDVLQQGCIFLDRIGDETSARPLEAINRGQEQIRTGTSRLSKLEERQRAKQFPTMGLLGSQRFYLSGNGVNQACGLLRVCHPSGAGSLPHVFV